MAASLHRPTPARTGQSWGATGCAALYRASTRIYADGSPHTKHVTTNSIIEVEEGADVAVALSCFTVFQQVDVFPLQAIVSGRYRDTFQRIDGRWWFDTRVMSVDLVGDLSRHLSHELEA